MQIGHQLDQTHVGFRVGETTDGLANPPIQYPRIEHVFYSIESRRPAQDSNSWHTQRTRTTVVASTASSRTHPASTMRSASSSRRFLASFSIAASGFSGLDVPMRSTARASSGSRGLAPSRTTTGRTATRSPVSVQPPRGMFAGYREGEIFPNISGRLSGTAVKHEERL